MCNALVIGDEIADTTSKQIQYTYIGPTELHLETMKTLFIQYFIKKILKNQICHNTNKYD